MTAYIITIIGRPQSEVTPAFGATSIIAPILGVVCGGIFIDKIGGYKGARHAHAGPFRARETDKGGFHALRRYLLLPQ